jgi:hypothetical protein
MPDKTSKAYKKYFLRLRCDKYIPSNFLVGKEANGSHFKGGWGPPDESPRRA